MDACSSMCMCHFDGGMEHGGELVSHPRSTPDLLLLRASSRLIVPVRRGVLLVTCRTLHS
eukprot:scaffold172735_cov35-Tisochrysis_lutea.AAC.2